MMYVFYHMYYIVLYISQYSKFLLAESPLARLYILYSEIWSSCTNCVSLSHYMITQSVRISEPNPMPTSSNPSQMNILQLLLKIFQWWILYISIHSTTLIWLPVRDTDSGKWGDWWRYMPKWNLNIERIGVAEKS